MPTPGQSGGGAGNSGIPAAIQAAGAGETPSAPYPGDFLSSVLSSLSGLPEGDPALESLELSLNEGALASYRPSIDFVEGIGTALSADASTGARIWGGTGALLSIIPIFSIEGTVASEGLETATTAERSFFEGTQYTQKVLTQMKGGVGEFHSFPESVTAFEKSGSVRTITGGDGVVRQMLEIPGSYNGRDGLFQFIKEADGMINHRLFVPGSLLGVP
jgi:hypothetical protein